MPIYLREISSNKKSFFIWIVILILFNLMTFSVYPSFASEAENIEQLIKSYPEAFIKIFGVDRLDITKILHFFGMEIYLFITLLGSIYSMILGSGIISKEEDDKTIEFLIAKPVSREKIVTSKALSVLSYILFFNVILFIADFGILEVFKTNEFNIKLYILLSVSAFLLHLTFAALGLFISIFITKARVLMSVSLGIVIGTYFLGLASSLSERLNILKYVSPFKYVDATSIITSAKIDYKYLIIMGSIISISVIGTYLFYHRKDIHS